MSGVDGSRSHKVTLSYIDLECFLKQFHAHRSQRELVLRNIRRVPCPCKDVGCKDRKLRLSVANIPRWSGIIFTVYHGDAGDVEARLLAAKIVFRYT